MSSTFDPVLKAKGDEGEADLRAWFDRYGFGYVAVCQNEETFAALFRDQVKRPDFLLLIDSLGIIAVDAKHKTKSKQRDCYTLSYDYEFRRALLFERIFRLPVWYAYRGPDADNWFWISALKAFEVGRKKGVKKSWLEIDLKHFECLHSGADFGKLYTQRMPSLTKLKTVL